MMLLFGSVEKKTISDFQSPPTAFLDKRSTGHRESAVGGVARRKWQRQRYRRWRRCRNRERRKCSAIASVVGGARKRQRHKRQRRKRQRRKRIAIA